MESAEPKGRVVVLGGTGQLGHALLRCFPGESIGLSRPQIDLTALPALSDLLETLRPALLVNTAAYTHVDRAETEKELAYAANAAAPGFLAHWCAERKIPFIHFSTNYVFPGSGRRPWTEDDPPSPVNVYGASKLEGERQVAAAGGSWLIFRTAWVYDRTRRNFLTTILRLAHEQKELQVVDDQWGAPTYAGQLAARVAQAIRRAQSLPKFPTGIYHLCHAGETSWYEFARAVLLEATDRGAQTRTTIVIPIASKNYPAAAKRPLNGRLSTAKAKAVFDTALPHWRVGLSACLKESA